MRNIITSAAGSPLPPTNYDFGSQPAHGLLPATRTILRRRRLQRPLPAPAAAPLSGLFPSTPFLPGRRPLALAAVLTRAARRRFYNCNSRPFHEEAKNSKWFSCARAQEAKTYSIAAIRPLSLESLTEVPDGFLDNLELRERLEMFVILNIASKIRVYSDNYWNHVAGSQAHTAPPPTVKQATADSAPLLDNGSLHAYVPLLVCA